MTRSIRLLFCTTMILGVACGHKDRHDDDATGGSAGATTGGSLWGGPGTGGQSTGGVRTGGTGGSGTGGSSTGGVAPPVGGMGASDTGGQQSGGTNLGGGINQTGGINGTGGTMLNCQGVSDGGDCTSFGEGYVCDRSSSTVNPRVCTCDGSEWSCVRENGTGGSGSGGTGPTGGVPGTGAAAGAAGSPSTLDCRGANDGGNCTSFGEGYVCDRSSSTVDPRVCTCDGSEWTCVHENATGGNGGGGNGGTAGSGGTGGTGPTGGTGGSGATGGVAGAAGGPPVLDCEIANDGGDCSGFEGDICDERLSLTDPRLCTCTNAEWVCIRDFGEGGAGGAGGTAGAGEAGSAGASGAAGAGAAGGAGGVG
ncbi:MAG: hypothetical protein JW751_23895 [Polyangiaceae bacterium]|nr:hypothetical protein [Polyangiaceae bacterium]